MDLYTFLTNCQTQLGYQFRDLKLLRKALTHSSGADTPLDSNERMEFLGDSVLGYVICNYLFATFPEMLEGDMTKIKSAVVSRVTCQNICKRLGLDKFLILGRGLGRSLRVPDSIFANAMESFIAAIYLDGGLEEARKFILKEFREEIEKMLQNHDADNFKSVLQHRSQKYLGHTPEYKLIEVNGPEHHKAFHIGVQIGEQTFPAAWGATKKEAEQRAAENAIAILQGDPPPYIH
jgi:ribonuclease-3